MFVRTKDGIYEIVKNIKGMNVVSKAGFGISYLDDFKENIINQSDNIEDLLDEYVFELDHSDYGKPTSHTFYSMEELDYMKRMFKYYLNSSCYGAIWTGKGLIYVAKLNEKGEWKLL